MKPPPFAYRAPRTLPEALAALAPAAPGTGSDTGGGGVGKVLAGGQSLIPLLNMRLAAPERLVDINRVAELDTLEVTGAGVRVGALARHARVGRSAEAAAVQPLLRRALAHVAHPVVRNRGTVVGSLAHADPSAELPAVLALLDGSVEAASAAGRRTIPAGGFFLGPLEPALLPGELAVSAFFPALPPRTGTAFVEIARRHGDYALVGVAATVTLDAGLRVAAARAGYLSVAGVPLVLDLTAACAGADAVSGGGDWEDAAAYARERVDPESDIHASADYRRHLAGVLTGRALRAATADAIDRAGEGR
ncbi:MULTISPECIES: FAD binding domain-containing protein [Thermomonosporaceae]|uniref:FAD binding domain-containing protein n=1 Tax=Thermomonosporaceae TaxID=2012 RepID=UPI00255A8EC0|nr:MULTISPECIES: FAD binding domain-containing protein [Thermomonosporaceae]MDL4771081.1 FAD binding domain-containing protein [Actinomadura xylanilytica]